MGNDQFSSVLGTVSTPDDAARQDNVVINDEQFIRDLRRLKELRSFLIQEAINIASAEDESNPLAFEGLNLLKYGYNGRAPTREEWRSVEDRTQVLFRCLTGPLRRRFILGEIPSWVSMFSIAMALLALAALMGAIFVPIRYHLKDGARAATLPFYLIWLMSLGAMGSVAFIGMNALSVQQDVTFDLSNRKLMILRIALGALFGLVLALPFGFDGFLQFIVEIASGINPYAPTSGGRSNVTTQAMLLLLPFVLGFSTSLVIMILNRLVDAVQAFFGRTGVNDRAQIPPPPPPTSSSTRSSPRGSS